jgi:hypothetical protein
VQTTPGVYFEFVNRRTSLQPLRTDIAAFMGYALRGPVLTPVKVENWRQFVAVFGGFAGYAYLAHAVRGFFGNGGTTCYIVRIADPNRVQVAQWSASLSGVSTEPQITIWASYHWQAVQAGLPARVENYLPAGVLPDASPGTWGNRLAVSLQPHSLGTTRSAGVQPDDTRSSYTNSLSGFYTGSYVRVIAGTDVFTRRVTAIEPTTRRLTWNQALPASTIAQSLHFETVEVSLFVHQDGQVAERFLGLGLHSDHPQFAERQISANSGLVRLAVAMPDDDSTLPDSWSDSNQWPLVDRQVLVGGRDGLATVTRDHYVAMALPALAKVSEISFLAAPDLVLQEAPETVSRDFPTTVDCNILDPVPQGKINGIVRDANSSTPLPIAGVTVHYRRGAGDTAAVGTLTTTTDHNGAFTMIGMPVGAVTLLLQRTGYLDLEITTEARISPPEDPAVFLMSPRSEPTVFDTETIFDIQAALVWHAQQNGCVALLDTPYFLLDLEQVQSWRRRFDSSFAALYYPWLLADVDPAAGLRELPPSGHIAGIIARTDLQRGIAYAPANTVIDDIRAVSHPVGEVEHGILNPLGINCIRVLPGRGIRIFGARTLSEDGALRYVNARRILLSIEKTLEATTQWAVFEPNNHVLRQALTMSLTTYLMLLWQQGALVGESADAAFRVRCDEQNNPPQVRDAGQLVADIAVALTVPYEFIHFRLERTEEAVEIKEV